MSFIAPTRLPSKPTASTAMTPRITEKAPLRTIELAGWKIESCKQPILNSAEIAHAETQVDVPLPEMIFGNNYLRIEHPASGFGMSFEALDALRRVQVGSDAARSVQVAYAEDWSRTHQTLEEPIDVVKPYDWTYTTDYCGTPASAPNSNSHQFEATEHGIDYERLKQREPILFFDDVVLFEDELADNGTAMLSVKVRVMPSGFLVLQRFFMRVDDVLLRMSDTRIYHAFGEGDIVREFSTREDRYSTIRDRIPQWKDLSALTDADWVAAVLPAPRYSRIERLSLV